MKELLSAALLFSVVWSVRPIGPAADVVQIKPAAAASTSAPAPEARTNDDDADHRGHGSSLRPSDGVGNTAGNGTSPCDRYLRSAEQQVEVRNPRNHKFVTSNGWAERQRPRPEISVYSRVEELPSPRPPLSPSTVGGTFYQQQRDSFYQHSRQPPVQRTSKRIIYYATLPDVIRPPAGYPPPAAYSADPFTLGPSPFSADFRQLQHDSNRKAPQDNLQRSRLTSYENAYNRGGGGGGGGGVTSVTSKSTAVYNSRYDEPAEFRDPHYRPNELTSSKFPSWAEPFYKSWSSSSWDRDQPSSPSSSFGNNNNRGGSSWDSREPLTRGGGGSSWDSREPLIRGSGSWDSREPLGGDGGGPWDNRGSSWENRGASWDKDLVEVPLQRPNAGNNNLYNNDKYPEVAVVQSGVIDVRGDRQQPSGGSPPQPPPPPRFTIVDVDPKPYHDRMQPPAMRYDERSEPIRYEAYTPPVRPPHAHRHFEQPQQPMMPMPPSMMRYEQQYRSPPPQQPPSTTHPRYGQPQQNQNKQPPNGYYETIKNNINTHQFMTSWTEVSTQDEVSPTHSVSIDVASVGNSTSVQNNTRITPNIANTAKIPK